MPTSTFVNNVKPPHNAPTATPWFWTFLTILTLFLLLFFFFLVIHASQFYLLSFSLIFSHITLSLSVFINSLLNYYQHVMLNLIQHPENNGS